MKIICLNCDYWDPDNEPDKYGGNCHRYPPEFSNLPLKAFPRTFKDDWCGEWASKWAKESPDEVSK